MAVVAAAHATLIILTVVHLFKLILRKMQFIDTSEVEQKKKEINGETVFDYFCPFCIQTT